MAVPRSGTLTFLFTDIEDSTTLAQQYPAAIPSLLARHHQILDEAVTNQNGRVFRIIGDGICAAFESAPDALNAALTAQQRIQHEPWTPAPIMVRMGIHSGGVSAGDLDGSADSYTGYLTLTSTQRIMSVAHGGQILLSSASAELVRGQLPQGITLRDLGDHQLKGLLLPVHLWQIAGPDLISDFPPLPSQSTTPSNLPNQLTSFVGRETEISEVKELLRDARLVTLTGPGGTGKTRLSLQIAANLLEQFPDGAWLAELASLVDPSLVPQVVAFALGVLEQPGRPLQAQLIEYLRPKKLLLVLDNCEHLVAACAQLADTLLRTCPELYIVASSREALGTNGEISYPVPPLKTPDLTDLITPSVLIQYESVRLFVERAQAVRPHFALTDANAAAVAQICRRLDGIPLAIELAAARAKLFTPEQIAARLDDRFRLLTGGSRTALPRQQTLLALIEWSYDLLTQSERALLRRLSVFAGGWTFEAADWICAQGNEPGQDPLSTTVDSTSIDVLDTVTQLVNKSLVVADERGNGTRYRFLETIRQFARDKLMESHEAEQLHTRHLEYYISMAHLAEPQLHSANQVKWLDRLDVEEDNFRAAQSWALESDQIEQALELAGALWWFWYIRDHFGEARERMSAALARSPNNHVTDAKIKVMNGYGFIRYAASNFSDARAVLEEAVKLSQRSNNRRGLAESLQFLGAVEFAEGTKTPRHYEYVRKILEHSLALWRDLDDKTGISWGLNLLAGLAQVDGDLHRARALWEESVALRRAVGDRFLLAYSLRRLADIALQQGDDAAAEAGYRESHLLLVETGGKAGIASSLAGFGGLALARGQIVRAARLFGAVQAILQHLAWRLPPADDEVYGGNLEKVRAQLNAAEFNTAWEEGLALDLEQAIAYALGQKEE